MATADELGDSPPTQDGDGSGEGGTRSATVQFGQVELLPLDLGSDCEEKFTEEELERFHSLLEQRRGKYRMLVGLLFYFTFTVVFLMLVFSSRRVGEAYDMQSAIKDLIIDEEFPNPQIRKSFEDVQSIAEFWEWLEGPFAQAITNEDEWSVDNYIYRYNKIIGGVRLRQVRVDAEQCGIYDAAARIPDTQQGILAPECWPSFGLVSESSAPYGPYTYTPESESHIPNWYGRLNTVTYPGGGFIQDIARDNVSNVRMKIKELQANGWIDQGSRAVFITMNLYNANTNQFMLGGMMIEMTSGGTLYPSYHLKTFRLYFHFSLDDWARMALEAVVILFIIALTTSEISEMLAQRTKWWKKFFAYLRSDSPWNYVDTLNVTLFWVVLVMYYMYAFDPVTTTVELNTSGYVNLEHYANRYLLIFDLMTVNILLTFFKIFKYLQVFPYLSVLGSTLRRASTELLAFGVFFIIVFGAFASMAHVAFGPHLFEFRDFLSAIASCFRMVLGEHDYRLLWEKNRILGPSFYFLFTILVYFCLSNMFVAIILNAYQTIMEQQRKARVMKAKLTRFKVKRPPAGQRFFDGLRGAFNEIKLHIRVLRCGGDRRIIPNGKVEIDGVHRKFLGWIHLRLDGKAPEDQVAPTIGEISRAIGVAPEYSVHMLRVWGTIQKQNIIRDALEGDGDGDDAIFDLMRGQDSAEVDLGSKYGKVGGQSSRKRAASKRFRRAVSQVLAEVQSGSRDSPTSMREKSATIAGGTVTPVGAGVHAPDQKPQWFREVTQPPTASTKDATVEERLAGMEDTLAAMKSMLAQLGAKQSPPVWKGRKDKEPAQRSVASTQGAVTTPSATDKPVRSEKAVVGDSPVIQPPPSPGAPIIAKEDSMEPLLEDQK